MGSSVSTRKLPETASKAISVKRTPGVNHLPSDSLKRQYEKHQEEIGQAHVKQASSLGQNDDSSQQSVSTNNSTHIGSQSPAKHAQSSAGSLNGASRFSQTANENHPEGKDGLDPQMSPAQEKLFIDSITLLGKQIHSSSETQRSDMDSMALRQLHFRKSVFQRGEKELELLKDPQGSAASTKESACASDTERTMIHPRTLGAILTDLEDSRTTKAGIMEDYRVSSEFLDGLKRFKVATTVYVEPKEDKEGEIATQSEEPGKTLLDYDGSSEIGERMDLQRINKLKGRLGMDE